MKTLLKLRCYPYVGPTSKPQMPRYRLLHILISCVEGGAVTWNVLLARSTTGAWTTAPSSSRRPTKKRTRPLSPVGRGGVATTTDATTRRTDTRTLFFRVQQTVTGAHKAVAVMRSAIRPQAANTSYHTVPGRTVLGRTVLGRTVLDRTALGHGHYSLVGSSRPAPKLLKKAYVVRKSDPPSDTRLIWSTRMSEILMGQLLEL